MPRLFGGALILLATGVFFLSQLSELPGVTADQSITGLPHFHDGDDLSILVHLNGVDSFERNQMCERDGACYPCGQHAVRYMKSLMATREATGTRKTVTCDVSNVDINGRLLAQCFATGADNKAFDLGEEMIRAGWAVPVDDDLNHQIKFKERYLTAYEFAKANKKGAHAGTFVPPKQWKNTSKRLACEAAPNKTRTSALTRDERNLTQ